MPVVPKEIFIISSLVCRSSPHFIEKKRDPKREREREIKRGERDDFGQRRLPTWPLIITKIVFFSKVSEDIMLWGR